MNRKIEAQWWVVFLVLGYAMSGYAASFGTGTNAFNLTFQPISGETNPSAEHNYGQVAYDYGIGTYEITADQWSKYVTITGGPVGSGSAYNSPPTTSGNQAVNFTSWDEAAQFVNWLNTSSGHTAAYNFDDDGIFSLWGDGEQSATSAFRHKDAIYVLPSENEWVKAAYWDGTELNGYSTGDAGTGGVNYNGTLGAIWDVGSGVEELNGTYDMMGNIWEWNESAFDGLDNSSDEYRVFRGGDYDSNFTSIILASRSGYPGYSESDTIGFRVAVVPEPVSIALIGLFGGGILFVRRIFMM